MAPTRAKPFHRDGWVYEEKYDGWRMIAYKNGSAVSRNGVERTERFRERAAAAGRHFSRPINGPRRWPCCSEVCCG